MPKNDHIATALAMLEVAEENLRAAKILLSGKSTKTKTAPKSKKVEIPLESLTIEDSPNNEADNIIEGEFNGQNMIGPDGKIYPVPANYASKSKLVAGDRLKLTIQEDGSYVYKQIGPAEREHYIGPLTYEDGQYKVLANGRAYNVLLASVTYYKASVGDKIALIVAKNKDSQWAAIDHVLPNEIDINQSAEDEIF